MKTKYQLLQIWLLCAALLPAAVQAQLIFNTNNGAITVMGYNGYAGILIIPSTTNGYPVTRIWDYAFVRQTPLSVTIPDSITYIGTSAFDGCSGLTNVTFGNSVSDIEQSAFHSCIRLSSVTIPGSVTNIGINAFGGCAKLGAITVNPTNSFYSGTNGILFNKNMTKLVQYPPAIAGGSYTIPNSVTNIGDFAFQTCFSLTNVTIPNSVTVLGNSAFYGCSGLPSVTIPDSVTALGMGAFYECASLNHVTIGTNVTTIGEEAFESCSLTSVTIPNSVHLIGNSVFYLCSSLTNVTMGANVAIIYNNIFLDCSNLTGIYFLGDASGSLYSDFDYDDNTATVYYLPWTTGWPAPGALFGGCPTALWLPQAQTSDAGFGVRTNQFGFNLTWVSDLVVVVEACTDLANPDWAPVGTNTLTGGSSYFSDSQWTNYPGRFYRLRSP